MSHSRYFSVLVVCLIHGSAASLPTSGSPAPSGGCSAEIGADESVTSDADECAESSASMLQHKTLLKQKLTEVAEEGQARLQKKSFKTSIPLILMDVGDGVDDERKLTKNELYSQPILLRTRNFELTKVEDVTNPWADALPCEESYADKCTCGHWSRWQDGGVTPVACVKNTLAAIYAIGKKAKDLGVHAVLGGGTLLGSRRCGAFIPWDYDGDTTIYVDSEEKKTSVIKEINAWAGGDDRPDSIWVTFGGAVNDWIPKGASTNAGNVHIDLNVEVGEKKLTPTVLNNIILYAPSDFVNELTHKYGADWKSIPKRWLTWPNALANATVLDEKNMVACSERMTEIGTKLGVQAVREVVPRLLDGTKLVTDTVLGVHAVLDSLGGAFHNSA